MESQSSSKKPPFGLALSLVALVGFSAGAEMIQSRQALVLSEGSAFTRPSTREIRALQAEYDEREDLEVRETTILKKTDIEEDTTPWEERRISRYTNLRGAAVEEDPSRVRETFLQKNNRVYDRTTVEERRNRRLLQYGDPDENEKLITEDFDPTTVVREKWIDRRLDLFRRTYIGTGSTTAATETRETLMGKQRQAEREAPSYSRRYRQRAVVRMGSGSGATHTAAKRFAEFISDQAPTHEMSREERRLERIRRRLGIAESNEE